MTRWTWPLLVLLSSSASAVSFKEGFQSCKVQVKRTSAETILSAIDIENTVHAPVKEALPLSLDTSFKLTCSFDEATSPAVHHSILLFTSGTDSFAVPTRIRKAKGRITLRLEYDLAKAPLELLSLSSTDEAIAYNLHVSSFDVKSPGDQLVVPVGSFRFADSVKGTAHHEKEQLLAKAPAEWDVASFRPQELKEWTFGSIETGRGSAFGVLGSISVVGPSIGLLVLLVSSLSPIIGVNAHAQPQISRLAPSLTLGGLSGRSALFVLSLFSLEGSIVAYWVKLRIFTFLPLFAVQALAALFVGKSALKERSLKSS